MSEQIPTASQYLQNLSEKPPVLVDVKVPSGFVFKFKKPNTIGIILSGGLPETAVNEAAEAWKEKGLVMPSGDSETDRIQAQIVQKSFEICDRMLELSHAPKIVLREAQNDNEISIAKIDSEDLLFLFQWTAAGGNTAAMLAMFPERSKQGPVVRTDTKRQRNTRVQISEAP